MTFIRSDIFIQIWLKARFSLQRTSLCGVLSVHQVLHVVHTTMKIRVHSCQVLVARQAVRKKTSHLRLDTRVITGCRGREASVVGLHIACTQEISSTERHPPKARNNSFCAPPSLSVLK